MIYNLTNLKNEFKKVEEWLSKEYLQVRTGRATPAILDSVVVESYGSFTPVKNLASITIEDAKTLRVAPWDKGVIRALEKAINTSNLGLSVSVDDAGIRVAFPQLTSENKGMLVKVLKEKLEDARTSVKLEREKVWQDIGKKEKEGEMSEDDKFRSKDMLQKEVDEVNGKLEELFSKKEKDILG